MRRLWSSGHRISTADTGEEHRRRHKLSLGYRFRFFLNRTRTFELKSPDITIRQRGEIIRCKESIIRRGGRSVLYTCRLVRQESKKKGYFLGLGFAFWRGLWYIIPRHRRETGSRKSAIGMVAEEVRLHGSVVLRWGISPAWDGCDDGGNPERTGAIPVVRERCHLVPFREWDSTKGYRFSHVSTPAKARLNSGMKH